MHILITRPFAAPQELLLKSWAGYHDDNQESKDCRALKTIVDQLWIKTNYELRIQNESSKKFVDAPQGHCHAEYVR